MSNSWPLAGERLPVVGRIKPASTADGSDADSDVVDMKNFAGAMCIFNLGDYGAGNDGSFAGAAYVSNDSGGASPVALTGKALTAANFTGSALDDAVGIIEVRADEMVVSGTEYRYLFFRGTPTNQAMTFSAIVLGLGARYQPGSDFDLAKVKEIV